MERRLALTGTPGTGKSTVARLISPAGGAVEVGELARRMGFGRPMAGGIEVDLPPLVRFLRRHRSAVRAELLVGHLAHLLPIQDVVVLRCHPRELGARLEASRRGSWADRRENMVAEAIGVITAEAVVRRRTVYEVDTTGKDPLRVAREVRRWMAGPRTGRWGEVDWLLDRSVTAHLLEWAE